MGQQMTIHGRLGADPRAFTTRNNKPMTRFSIACTERYRDANGAWVDGNTSWFDVVAFDRLAQNAQSSLHKGDLVVVVGDLTISESTNEATNITYKNVQVKATTIGHSLTAGTTSLLKTPRADAEVAGWPAQRDMDADESYRVTQEPAQQQSPQEQTALENVTALHAPTRQIDRSDEWNPPGVHAGVGAGVGAGEARDDSTPF